MMTKEQLIERDAKRNLGAKLPNAETVAAIQEARAIAARFNPVNVP